MFGANGPFWAQKWHILITLDLLQEFFKILYNENSQYVDESNNNGLYQKKFVQDKWAILGPKMAHPQLWIDSKNFFKILQNERG